MRPAFNFEPKYRVTMLTMEEWIRGNGTAPVVKGLVWFTDGSRMEGTGVGVYGQSAGRRLGFSLGRYATVFQAEIYLILACAHEIQFQGRPEKHVISCSDSQVALEALQTFTTTSQLVQQCQKALNCIFTRHAVRLYWVPKHAGLRGNEIANELARGGSALKFVGPEPALGVSRHDIRKRIRRWLVNQHWVWW